MGEISITKLDVVPRNSSGESTPHTLEDELEWDLVHALNDIFLNNDIDSVHASVDINEVSVDITYKEAGSWTNIKFDLVEG